MKKNMEKKSLSRFFGIIAVFACVLCSLVFCAVDFSNVKASNALGNYVDANIYIEPLVSQTAEAEYNLMDEYPILPENQVNSEFCWIYSPMKSLETTLMKATGEYYNFSETATALLGYIEGKTSTFNSVGDFDSFDEIVRSTGLVFESELSNDNFYGINDDNAENFSYIKNSANKIIYQSVKPIKFSSSTIFSGAKKSIKQNILKNFIKTHGSVFIGISSGTIYKGTNGNTFDSKLDEGTKDDGGILIGENGVGHAVNLIGWDSLGFIALNTWGVESTDYTTFRIPYEIDTVYDVLFGYVYIKDSPVSVSSSSANNFSSNILGSAQITKNIFTADEALNIKYIVPENTDFQTLFVKIYRGSSELTKWFSMNYQESSRLIEITSNFDSSSFYGGTYVVYIYQDINLIDVKNITLYTGTEISYVKLVKDSSDKQKDYDKGEILSSFSSADNVATFYVPSTQSFKFYLNLTRFNTKSSTMTPTIVFYNDIYVYKTESNGNVVKQLADSSLTGSITGSVSTISDPNHLEVNIMGLRNFIGQRLEFKIAVTSHYTSIVQDYYINLFVSSFSTTNLSNAKTIEYVLNGGLNSNFNVNKFPTYSNETSMTSIELYDATKDGYNFLGWFTDKEMTNEITKIDSTVTDNLILYAKFEESTVSYFDFDIELFSKTSYLDETSPWTSSSTLVYGDSLNIKYTFNGTASLAGQNFAHKYYLYVNNNLFREVNLDTSITETMITFEFPELVAGSYNIKIISVVVANRNVTESKEKSLYFSVEKKQLNIVFDNEKLNFVYDGKVHSPNDESLNAISIDGVYNEDLAEFSYEFDNTAKKDFGDYVFKIKSISNLNYSFDPDASGTMHISKQGLTVDFKNLNVTYNGLNRTPAYTLDGVVEGDNVSLDLTAVTKKDVGTYDIVVGGLSNQNYYIENEINQKFTIEPALIIISVSSVVERVQTHLDLRKMATYSISSGSVFQNDDLGVNLVSEGFSSQKSGVFKISATISNSNYKVVVNEGNYTLTGYYYVHYTLPNGEIYVETVDDGENPKGIDSSIYPKGIFEGYSYSQKLQNINEDLYITVSINNYFWIYMVVIAVLVFGIIYWALTRKQRRNKTR